MENEKRVLLVDMKTKRPGCVLLQAAVGGDTGLLKRVFMDSSIWETGLTPDLKMVRGTEEEWKRFAQVAEAENKRRTGSRSKVLVKEKRRHRGRERVKGSAKV